MKKINCLIIDDEPLALDLLESYVLKTPFLELKGRCNSAIEAIETINSESVDLLFIDIQMPDLSGLEFSRTLSSNIKVIFTTAFSEYALDGYKVNALDYLLKPFNYEEFLKASLKAKEWFELTANKQTATNDIDKDFIFVKSEYKQLKIKLDDIQYIEGLKDYVKIWILNQPQPILSLMSLKHLEEGLPSNKFMRVHRSFIVALNKIQAVERGQILINKERITVADQYKEAFSLFIAGKTL
ncbi:MAG: LytTR family DNA-binding domain-containing protein [Paludibacteraceae bacterium]|nr:LytTR family DNA-binding domain-containing protein [Paludibacteraceae bacterium]